ncbi:hypothetical protein BpHYR1_046596 [Brachionus plicatilis]|uniref:Uncharacterized protein n=1 Tax=Brachionus plicatilis TaxID=10195 RepID=A0A3M7S2Y3_BRAPC|nr:hypothetical protein BpHYR1_046596 [Brachionus plicatilis]
MVWANGNRLCAIRLLLSCCIELMLQEVHLLSISKELKTLFYFYHFFCNIWCLLQHYVQNKTKYFLIIYFLDRVHFETGLCVSFLQQFYNNYLFLSEPNNFFSFEEKNQIFEIYILNNKYIPVPPI